MGACPPLLLLVRRVLLSPLLSVWSCPSLPRWGAGREYLGPGLFLVVFRHADKVSYTLPRLLLIFDPTTLCEGCLDSGFEAFASHPLIAPAFVIGALLAGSPPGSPAAGLLFQFCVWLRSPCLCVLPCWALRGLWWGVPR